MIGRLLCRFGFHRWFIVPTATALLHACDRCQSTLYVERKTWK